MHKQEETAAAQRRKQVYDAPVVEMLQARVEKRFAGSQIIGEETGEGLIETGEGGNELFS